MVQFFIKSICFLFLFFGACIIADDSNAESTRMLTVALLPIIDTLPYHVADETGIFEQVGLKVVAKSVGSALERDQLMQTGQIDGVLNDMISTAIFIARGAKVKIVGNARVSAAGSPLFRILSSPGSSVFRPKDLIGIPIGISRHTIIEYVTDRLLESEGLNKNQILKESVPIIPERYQLLLQGQIHAATIPDPLGLSAKAAGAIEVMEDSRYPQYAISVLSFSEHVLKKNPDAVRRFVHGWYKAAEKINKNPEAFRSLMLKRIRIPDTIRSSYGIPPFPLGSVPKPEQWSDVINWMMGQKLINSTIPYEDGVSKTFLPGISVQ